MSAEVRMTAVLDQKLAHIVSLLDDLTEIEYAAVLGAVSDTLRPSEWAKIRDLPDDPLIFVSMLANLGFGHLLQSLEFRVGDDEDAG